MSPPNDSPNASQKSVADQSASMSSSSSMTPADYQNALKKALANRSALMGSPVPPTPLTTMEKVLLHAIPGAAQGYQNAARIDQTRRAQAQQDFMDHVNVIKASSALDSRNQEMELKKRQDALQNFTKFQGLIDSLISTGNLREARLVQQFAEKNGVMGTNIPDKAVQLPKEALDTYYKVLSMADNGHFAEALSLFNKAGLPAFGLAPPTDPENLSKDAVEQGVYTYMNTGKLPYVRGKAGARMQVAIMNGIKNVRKSLGLSREEFSMIPAMNSDNKALLLKMAQQAQTLEATHDTVLSHMKMAEDQVKKVYKTGNLGANVAMGFIQRQMGNEDYARFMSTNRMLQSEFARMMIAGPSGAGQLTDAARAEAGEFIDPNTPLKTYLALLANLKKLSAARMNAIRKQRRQRVIDLMNPMDSMRNPSGAIPAPSQTTSSPRTLHYDPLTGNFVPSGGP